MKRALAIMLSVTVALTACGTQTPAADDAPGGQGQGRYIGVGLYSTDQLWEHLVQKEAPEGTAPQNAQAALLADDTEIIVTVDSHTGEVRQCGNYSGHCIRSNPWKTEAASSPAALVKHASDLKREREEEERALEAKARGTAAKP